ncbi:MAG: hypothetical protein H7Z75_07005 [Ferruginibacter sp.]|nr:hypothetical protein [Cytophagales bacterium]
MTTSKQESEKESFTVAQYRIWKEDFDARHAGYQRGSYLEKPLAEAADRIVQLGILFNTILAAALFF